MSTRILFTGYAHVHFACFRPLFDRLVNRPGVEVLVSGGIRHDQDGVRTFDLRAMYDPFGVPPECTVEVEALAGIDADVLFAANTKLIEPRSVGKRVQIFHGISFRNRAIRDDNMSCDAYFLAGPYMRRRFAEASLLPEDDPRGLGIGFMKTDRLVDGTWTREELLGRYGLGGTRPVILYAPTGQKMNSLETMGKAVIRNVMDSGRYDLVIKPHDHPKKKIDWFSRLAKLEGEHCRIVRELDVIPLLAMADILITDASSVSSEYSLVDRPMVFLDVPELIAKAGGRDGSMMDLETWGRSGGPVVEGPDDVVAALDAQVADPAAYAEARRSMSADLFYNPGRATDAAVAWLEQAGLVPAAEDSVAHDRRA